MKIPSQSYCKLLLPAPFYIPYVPAPQNSLPFPNEVYERLRMLWLYSAYYWVPFIFSLYPVRFKSVFSYTHQDTTQIHLNTTENLFSRCYALPDWSFPSMSTTIPSSLYYDIVLLLVYLYHYMPFPKQPVWAHRRHGLNLIFISDPVLNIGLAHSRCSITFLFWVILGLSLVLCRIIG